MKLSTFNEIYNDMEKRQKFKHYYLGNRKLNDEIYFNRTDLEAIERYDYELDGANCVRVVRKSNAGIVFQIGKKWGNSIDSISWRTDFFHMTKDLYEEEGVWKHIIKNQLILNFF